MEQTRSLGVGCQVPFLLNGSRLTAFIHASLSCLHLMGPGKVCKWSGGLHSRQSPFLWQLPWASRLCSVQVSFFHLLILWGSNTTIYFWHDERYVLKTTMIWKLRLAFDVCTSFSQAIWKKAQHDSDFLPPLATHVFKNIMAHSYGK